MEEPASSHQSNNGNSTNGVGVLDVKVETNLL